MPPTMFTNHTDVMSPQVSLIICTYNRCEKLQRCLNAIEKIRREISFELIVVDNNSTDNTLTVIANHAVKSNIPMRWQVETKRGTGAGRNCGAKLATSEIMVYLDDDCYPAEDFVDQYYRIFAAHREIGFIGGRIELYDKNDYPITILTLMEERFFSPKTRLRAGEIMSANMGIRKSAFAAVLGWDEKFGAGTDFPSEDLDLAARILCKGWLGKYDPAPMVYHHHERKHEEDAARLMASYDAGRGGFYGKCLFDREMRKIYLWPWIKSCRRKNAGETYREVKSFFQYIFIRLSSR